MLVHTERREVLPVVPPEPSRKADREGKNDCERNASKHLLREHPHLPLVVEDGLSSNGPRIRLLKELDMRFVLGAKRGDQGGNDPVPLLAGSADRGKRHLEPPC